MKSSSQNCGGRVRRVHFNVLVLGFLLTFSVADDDPSCTLCPNGGETPLLDKLLMHVNWPASVYNCTQLDDYATSLSLVSTECTKVQSISSLCGCPVPDSSCQLCPNNGNVTKHFQNLTFLANNFDGIVPTCQLLDAFVHSVPFSTTKCKESRIMAATCGCPIRENACHLCAEGRSITDPDKRSSQFRLGLQEWDLEEPPTCELVSSAVFELQQQDSSACRETQAYGFVCDCGDDDEYNQRQRILAWIPRGSAVLSFFGSLFIMYDIGKKPKSQRTTQHLLLLVMSFFDKVSSIAWGLTTLPVPTEDEYGEPTNVYGARGNDATCTAQGFFIQLGLTSPFINLSLAVYYMMIILYSWKEDHVKKYKWVLLGVPLTTGFALAFAAIPKYGQDIIMCYIPHGDDDFSIDRFIFLVLPIGIVIIFATIAMALIYKHVYNQEQSASQWRMTQQDQSLSRKVFWQGFWYLMCFYASWPVLILVVTLDSNLFHRFGFLCFAMFLAPIQGFTNFIAYARPRFLRFLRAKNWCCCATLQPSAHCEQPQRSTTRTESSTTRGQLVESSPVVTIVDPVADSVYGSEKEDSCVEEAIGGTHDREV